MRPANGNQVYILRVWQRVVTEDGYSTPIYILEDPVTRARRGFTTLQEFIYYLETLEDTTASPSNFSLDS